jgi:hypothetical protein
MQIFFKYSFIDTNLFCSIDCETECYRPIAQIRCQKGLGDKAINVFIQIQKSLLPKIVRSILAVGDSLPCKREIIDFLSSK